MRGLDLAIEFAGGVGDSYHGQAGPGRGRRCRRPPLGTPSPRKQRAMRRGAVMTSAPVSLSRHFNVRAFSGPTQADRGSTRPASG